ncbi:MAG: hypothetical protein IPH18_16880 [Chitinophagaceae bacterium]|nr:hypothetical protein [Chitinophagaceae bacterium]
MPGCKKNDNPDPTPPTPAPNFLITNWDVDGVAGKDDNKGISINPYIRLHFPVAIDRSSVAGSVILNTADYTVYFQNGDSVLILQPASPWLILHDIHCLLLQH